MVGLGLRANPALSMFMARCVMEKHSSRRLAPQKVEAQCGASALRGSLQQYVTRQSIVKDALKSARSGIRITNLLDSNKQLGSDALRSYSYQ